MAPESPQHYNPLEAEERVTLTEIELDVVYGLQSRRVPIRVRFDAERQTPQPVILFSHGLGGSNRGGSYLAEHWARRGYVTVALQHMGSDESVWWGVPRAERMESLREAANLRQSIHRMADVPAVIDALGQWNDQRGHTLAGRLDPEAIGMSGHSFGAGTTQWVSGQRFRGSKAATDPRIDAALMMSPSSPARGDPDDAFGAVEIPWMLMTGTKDVSVVNNRPVSSRLSVYPALPPGDKYELVLKDGEHHAFSSEGGRNRPRNPNHHRVILALSTAFWDTYLRNDQAAREWLTGEGPSHVLEVGDRWQTK
ncbi:MAG: acetylhydrolase [Synoicihabitans sp.]